MSGSKSETEIVARALARARVQWPLGFWWRSNSGRRGGVSFGFKGLPDICGIQQWGGGAFIEVKTKTGQLSREQWYFLNDMNARGCLVRVFIENDFYPLAQVPDKNMPKERRI